MKRWLAFLAVVAPLAFSPSVALAQPSAQDEEERDPYAEYEDVNRFALGVGIGLIEPSDSNFTETYLAASLRIRAGRQDGDHSAYRRDQGIRGYVEPEIGYWKTNQALFGNRTTSAEDLLLGVNIVGVVPFGNIESFFGAGAGVHLLDNVLLDVDPTEIDDPNDQSSKLGVNAHFGLDLFLTEHLSIFGSGRFDLVQDTRDSVQTKVYLGLRAHF